MVSRICKNITILTPTGLLFFLFDKKYSRRSKFQNALIFDLVFLCLAIFLVAVHVLLQDSGWQYKSIMFYLLIIQGSRCIEVPLAFLSDTLDKLKDPGEAAEKAIRRIELAIIVYFELMLNYALIYSLTPYKWWKFNISLEDLKKLNIIDADITPSIFTSIYYSVVTLTTLGYGDISPLYFQVRFLSITEVFSSIIIIVLSVAIYASSRKSQ